MNTPLVFLPGLFETPHIWQSTIDRLKLPADRVAHLHLWGHKPEDRGAFDLDTWVADAVGIIRAHGGDRPVTLISHSTGGLLSLILAKRHPEFIRSLVLTGSLTCGHRDRAARLEEKLLTRPLMGRALFSLAARGWVRSRAGFERALSCVMAPEIAAEVPDDMRLMLSQCSPAAALTMARWVLRTSIIDQLPQIRVPILAMIGQHDMVVPPLHQLRMMQAAPSGEGCLLDAGHLPFLENPAAFDRALRGWLMRPHGATPLSARAQPAPVLSSNALRAASTAPRLVQVQQ